MLFSQKNDAKNTMFLKSFKQIKKIAEIWLLNKNSINAKYPKMAFRSLLVGTSISPNQQSFVFPGQTKVSGDYKWETTHEICCLAAKCKFKSCLACRLSPKFGLKFMNTFSVTVL